MGINTRCKTRPEGLASDIPLPDASLDAAIYGLEAGSFIFTGGIIVNGRGMVQDWKEKSASMVSFESYIFKI